MFDLKERIKERRDRRYKDKMEGLERKLSVAQAEAKCSVEEHNLRVKIQKSKDRIKVANKDKHSLLGDGLKGAAVIGKALGKGVISVAENCKDADLFEQPKQSKKGKKKQDFVKGSLYDNEPMF